MGKHASKKRKSVDTSDDSDAGNALSQRLIARGERFMQMFDDDGARAAPAVSQPEPAASSDAGEASSELSLGHSSGDSSEGEEQGVVEYVFDSVQVAPAKAKRKSLGGPSAAGHTSSPAALEAQKRARRIFMSHKAGVVSAGDVGGVIKRSTPSRAAEAGQPPNGMSRKDFLDMQREVHLYGAHALDKKAKKQFTAGMLEQLGAKRQKGPRIPASIGLGLAKKQAKRAAVAKEEAIAAGMVKVKGTGKKRRREQQGALDWGLNEDGGAYRGGVLRVRKGNGGSAGRGGGPRRR